MKTTTKHWLPLIYEDRFEFRVNEPTEEDEDDGTALDDWCSVAGVAQVHGESKSARRIRFAKELTAARLKHFDEWIPDLDTDLSDSAKKDLYKVGRERKRKNAGDDLDEQVEEDPEKIKQLKRLQRIADFAKASATGAFRRKVVVA
jgi:hypothetical protein